MKRGIVRRSVGLRMVGVAIATGCASAGGGAVGAVNLSPPQPAHGDDLAIAWPFTLVHGAGAGTTVADFHLRIETGGTLLAVRPDSENPDTGARFRWRGEVRDGAGYWIGDPLVPGDGVTLTILVRPQPVGDPRLRVVHWPTDGRDQPVGPETCEIWSYDTGSRRVGRTAC